MKHFVCVIHILLTLAIGNGQLKNTNILHVIVEHVPGCNSQSPKVKKEISWDDKEYQDNVVLKEMIARSDVWMLDRKASVGPCFRPGMPFEGPSGIMICLPKKSLKTINQASGISINISKKTMMSKTKLEANREAKKLEDNEKCNKEDSDSFNKFFSNVKDKFTNLQSKMKRVFQV